MAEVDLKLGVKILQSICLIDERVQSLARVSVLGEDLHLDFICSLLQVLRLQVDSGLRKNFLIVSISVLNQFLVNGKGGDLLAHEVEAEVLRWNLL